MGEESKCLTLEEVHGPAVVIFLATVELGRILLDLQIYKYPDCTYPLMQAKERSLLALVPAERN